MARTKNANIRHDNVSQTSQEPNPEDFVAVEPTSFFFTMDKYCKSCKISTRCELQNTIVYLKRILTKKEQKWFYKHPQFGHLFHMELEKNHRLMGMWMLLLRTVITKKKNEAWFVVNGVPIRYSMREHVVITGFNCNQFPKNYMRLGSDDFVDRRFGRINKIDQNHIRDALNDFDLWENARRKDKLKMAVLYFLVTVIKPSRKTSMGYIDLFLLRIVNDLDACKTFPWGRLTFNDNIEEIGRLMTRLNGSIPTTCNFPGFILPLEVLAFECIPQLDRHFREDVDHIHINCPRMCKRKFKSLMCKGFSLGKIYEVLGTTKEIKSILEVMSTEVTLLENYVGSETEDDSFDSIVDSWVNHLEHKGSIFWERLFDADVASKTPQIPPLTPNVEAPPSTPNIEAAASATDLESHAPEPNMVQNHATIKSALDSMKEDLIKFMNNNFKRVGEDGEVQMLKEEVEMLKAQVEMLKEQVEMLESDGLSANVYGAGSYYGASPDYGARAGVNASLGVDASAKTDACAGVDASTDAGAGVKANLGVDAREEGEADACAGVFASTDAEADAMAMIVYGSPLSPPMPPKEGNKTQGKKKKNAGKNKRKLNHEENILPENSKRVRFPGVQTLSPFELGSA